MPPPRRQTVGLPELLNRVERPCEADCFLPAVTGVVKVSPPMLDDICVFMLNTSYPLNGVKMTSAH